MKSTSFIILFAYICFPLIVELIAALESEREREIVYKFTHSFNAVAEAVASIKHEERMKCHYIWCNFRQ